MGNERFDKELDELIRASMELEDIPAPELNKQLKVSLYQREAALRQAAPMRPVRLWFVPMILNLVIFSLLGALALLAITNPFLARLAAGACAYFGVAGILITVVGVKRTNMKEAITVYVQKRGVLI